MEHYNKQSAIAFDLWQLAMDENNEADIKKHQATYLDYQEMIKRVS